MKQRKRYRISCHVGKAPHSPTLTSLHLRHSSFSNPSAALPTSQLIRQPFRCFTYVIGTSPTSSSEPPMPPWWCLIYSWWFCSLQWLRPVRLYEKCKLALELKRLKTPGLKRPDIYLTGEEKPHPGNLSRPGIEPCVAGAHASPVPQRWTPRNIMEK